MREQRVAEAIREELSAILREEMRDPRVGLMSVTKVEVSTDLSVAKVGVSVLGTEQQRSQTLRMLEKARGFIRSQLASRMSMRHVPELKFKIDTSIEHGLRISQLLNDIRKEDSNDEDKEPK